ncbi:MAG: RNA 3'-terminal phosphate cyclase [Planctomycetota bacterium]|jgi:RNA 3'-terminal phosphate cyclase (ATP)
MVDTQMIEIDGSQGEGGGQVLRSSLTLAMVTGQPVRLTRIRAGRKKPGLMRAHLTAVQAAAEVSDAQVDGASLGSAEITFRPQHVSGGEYTFQIGTAGSTSLVLQTVLPALLRAAEPSTVRIEGGTHNPMAPPFEFLQRTYVPLVERLGPQVAMKLNRAGFYPAGGGSVAATVTPAESLGPLELLECGALQDYRVEALVARLPEKIGRRECSTFTRKLNWPESVARVISLTDTASPGNALIAELQFEHVTEVFVEFGERGKPAERVAASLAKQVCRFVDSGVPVGEHLADQLLLPLAIGAWQGTGGGSFRTLALTDHSKTHIEIIRTFLDVKVEVTETSADDILVEIRKS